MTLPPLQHQAAEALLGAYCEKRIPEFVRSQLRLEYRIRGDSAELIERRVPWRDPEGEWTSAPMAKFTFDEESNLWTLKWRDRNGRFHEFAPTVKAAKLGDLIEVVDRDETGIFWG